MSNFFFLNFYRGMYEYLDRILEKMYKVNNSNILHS
jgi:hypothetical protein